MFNLKNLKVYSYGSFYFRYNISFIDPKPEGNIITEGNISPNPPSEGSITATAPDRKEIRIETVLSTTIYTGSENSKRNQLFNHPKCIYGRKFAIST